MRSPPEIKNWDEACFVPVTPYSVLVTPDYCSGASLILLNKSTVSRRHHRVSLTNHHGRPAWADRTGSGVAALQGCCRPRQ